eukprot:m.172004 g.172004  ORF g.172004 m.172004 type:complete len:58 (-) comp25198_c0_seq4:57-230(-)
MGFAGLMDQLPGTMRRGAMNLEQTSYSRTSQSSLNLETYKRPAAPWWRLEATTTATT